jgi:hypothetical protein
LAHAEAQVLPVADGRRRHGLGRSDEEGDVGVAEAEGRHPRELLCEVERQVARGDHGVDRDDLEGVVEGDVLVGVPGEGIGERGDVLLGDREASRRSVPAESLEVARARREPACRSKLEIERPEPFHESCERVTRTTGRWNRSARRDATMPITPSCQSSLQRT